MLCSNFLLSASAAVFISSSWAQTTSSATIDAARAAARADRNGEAAELFRSAIEQSPDRRRELLPEYADQLLYSQRALQALPLYEEVLQSPRSADERRHALKGRGLAFLWTDQAARARPLFEALASEQPDDADTSRNLGRALSWSGRQRAAEAHLRRHLQKHPSDGEARVQLAQAQAWMGRGDEALATLEGVQRDDAKKLAEQVRRDAGPRSQIAAEHSTQSDDLAIRAWRAGQTMNFADGRGMLGLRLDRIDYQREDGTDSARVSRPMILGRWRFSDEFEANVEVGRERIAARGTRPLEFTAHNAWLTWWPHDFARIDLSHGRGDFDNLQSLRQGITHRDSGLSVDLTPDAGQRYSARFQHMDISDGNRRKMGQLEGEYQWRTRPELWLGARYTHFEFDRQANNGYFNPLRFDSLLFTARAAWRPGGDSSPWELHAYGAYGRERAVPDGEKPAYDLSVRAAYRFDSATRLEARAQRFSSRTSTATGFARTTFGINFERTW